MKPVPNEIFFAEVERLLAEENRVAITVQGNSMRPFMRSSRTQVVLARCDAGSLERGDVVLFRYRGRHILHRIVRIVDGRFMLAGDGNFKGGEECAAVDIVAKVESVIGANGRVTECSSRRWRFCSRCWLLLPRIVRRCILKALRCAGIK